MHELAQEIKRLRLQSGWNQAEAAKHCGINPSIFSRLESGKIETPTDETIARLAKGFQIPVESILSFIPSAETKFRVGFSHSLWAAPVIPFLMEGPPPKGIKLTSYGEAQPAESFAFKPIWYDSDAKAPFFVGPSFGGSQCELPAGYSRHADSSKFSPYYAPDLDRLLQNQSLDCVIATKQVFSAHDSVLLPCARIMDCAGGNRMMIVWKKDAKYQEVFAKYENLRNVLWPALEEDLVARKLKIKTFYGLGTSAGKTLELFGTKVIDKQPLILRDWPSVLSHMETAFNEQDGFLVLGWEPLMSWVKPRVKTFSAHQIIEKVHVITDGPTPYLSFDIMFSRANARKWIESDIARQFLDQVRVNMGRLKAAIVTQNKEATVVSEVAAYLNMDTEACLKALSQIHFDSLLFYPEWLEYRDSILI